MLYHTYEKNPVNVEKNVKEESYEIPNSGGARTSNYAPPGKLIRCMYEDATTMIEALHRGYRQSGNGRCLGWRTSNPDYSWISYGEFIDRAQNFGSGLANLRISTGQTTFIGICAPNSVEYLVAEYGCLHQSCPIIPLHMTLEASTFISLIKQGGISIMICDQESKVKSLLERISEIPMLKNIILMDSVSEELKMLGREKCISLHTLKEIEVLGKVRPVQNKLPQPSDLAIVCYTSGTTGDSKGVLLTHENVIAGVTSFTFPLGDLMLNENDVTISYLPLVHMYERLIEVAIFTHGGSVGFFGGNISRLTDDMKTLQPTVFPTVPRILNRLYDQVQANINSEKTKLNVSPKVEGYHADRSEKYSSPACDDQIYKSFSDSLGGKVRFIISGAAPISENVLRFYRLALNCEITEVYGQTECCGPCASYLLKDDSIGSSGPPLPTCMIKLEDVPELGYFASERTGEVCVKGPNVFQGYLNDPQRTEEALDNEGWLHTGDVGKWLPNGTLKIIDRKKNIFKLSQGKYIAPEKIENIYMRSPYISQILVNGDSLQSFLVAIVIPDTEAITSWCKENLNLENMNEICKDKAVNQFILEDMKRIGSDGGLLPFEQVRKIHLHPTLLTTEEGLLTPTLKIKRALCQKHFFKEIQAMYENKDV